MMSSDLDEDNRKAAIAERKDDIDQFKKVFKQIMNDEKLVSDTACRLR